MTIGSILLALALTLIIVLFIARPFLLPKQRPPRLTEHQQLQAAKEALLAQIAALDFDAETDKQEPDLYNHEREQLVQQAAVILQQLEETTDHDQAIEAAVARLLQQENKTETASLCPNCTTPTRPSDRFCPHCGHNLQATTANSVEPLTNDK